MKSKSKAEALGRVLITSKSIDTDKGQNGSLQKLLGDKIYYKKNNKWYYNTEELKKKTIAELDQLSEKIIKLDKKLARIVS